MRSGNRALIYVLAVVMLTLSVEVYVVATTPLGVPEIDAGGISAGLALLAGGVLILRSRKRSK
jgi:LPXTG-motif cell wall-anchored protein